jgi:hypothetical protein
VGLKARLDAVEMRKFLALSGLEFRPLDLPTRRQSLYRLRYLDSRIPVKRTKVLHTLMFFFRENDNGMTALS